MEALDTVQTLFNLMSSQALIIGILIVVVGLSSWAIGVPRRADGGTVEGRAAHRRPDRDPRPGTHHHRRRAGNSDAAGDHPGWTMRTWQ